MNWDTTDRLKVRAAASRALGCPSYDDLAMHEVVSIAGQTHGGGRTITSGNPGLTPRIADHPSLALQLCF